jgi:hypothetical protein
MITGKNGILRFQFAGDGGIQAGKYDMMPDHIQKNTLSLAY